MRKFGWVVALLVLAAAVPACGDDLDYSVTGAAPAEVKVCGDGTVFVEYVDPLPGATYRFLLNVWVDSGGAAAPFPTAAVPIEFMKLSGTDATGWFAAATPRVSFEGYGVDPAPKAGSPGYTGTPGGSYRSVVILLTIPAAGLPADDVQVKVKARTRAIPRLGEGHGVIVRLSRSAAASAASGAGGEGGTGTRDGSGGGGLLTAEDGSILGM